jgi:hypothetical protein
MIFFSHFIAVFTFSTASATIYGNVPWTLKTPFHIITNYSYSFPSFIAVFIFNTASATIYGNVPWTLKTPFYIITISLQSPIFGYL